MVRGIYNAANGLLAQSAVADTISGNLAGLAVPGYRRGVPVVSRSNWLLEMTSAGDLASAGERASVLNAGAQLDLTSGPIRHTGAQFDLSLEGPGYFCVQTPAGTAYTRGGAFRLDSGGWLVTASGDRVLGQNGPIQIAGNAVEFHENGEVVVDGAAADRIRVVEIAPGRQVGRLGGGLLQAAPTARIEVVGEDRVRVRQGYLEQANVNAVAELASMISALRAFEASQRVLQASDETLDKVINETGRV